MEKRFTAVIGDGTEHVKWEEVFDESAEMPGHQTKYRHMLDRTYLRPRDMIRFCNSVLAQYKVRTGHGSGSVGARLFENVDINKARPDYSQYLLKELDDEIHKHLPNYQLFLGLLEDLV